jgi:hypothetical protein
MNVALSTIILFVLLLPGIFFRRFYYSAEFSHEYFKETFFSIFISTIIPSLIFQALWFFISPIWNFKVDLLVFFDLLTNKPKASTIKNIEDYSLQIFWYHLTMYLFAILLGYLSRKIVRYWKLDRKFKILRFKNNWHYLLKGEFFDFPDAEFNLQKDSVEDIEFVFVDVVVELSGASILYDGVLVDYSLSNIGGLESITLKNVQRRNLQDDCEIKTNGTKKTNSNKFYPIDGHLVLFKYKEIKNLNFTYYKLKKSDSGYYPKLIE